MNEADGPIFASVCSLIWRHPTNSWVAMEPEAQYKDLYNTVGVCMCHATL